MGGDARGRLGWATYGEDENVNELERRGAELLGKEAAVLVPTCSMANLVAVLALPAGRPRAVEPDAHIVVNEGDWLTEVARLEIGEPAARRLIENTHTRRGGTVAHRRGDARAAPRARPAPTSTARGSRTRRSRSACRSRSSRRPSTPSR